LRKKLLTAPASHQLWNYCKRGSYPGASGPSESACGCVKPASLRPMLNYFTEIFYTKPSNKTGLFDDNFDGVFSIDLLNFFNPSAKENKK
jgi:hypothetical protein